MRDSALYFPFISIPASPWLINTLLYWDTIGSIVPVDHIFGPADGGFMRELVQNRLVTPIFPREHLYQIPDYEMAFMEHLKSKRLDFEKRVRDGERLGQQERVPVHMEKLQGIGSELEKLKLAHRDHGDWFSVDPWVANHFMTYLAALLGRLESVGAAPITDDSDCFKLLAGNAALSNASESRLTSRAAILNRVLPVPVGAVNIVDLANFKKERGSQLSAFRREIENKCIAVAQAHPDDRADALLLAGDELCKERDSIAGKMKDRWKEVLLNPIYSIVGAGITVATKPMMDPVYGTVAITGAGLSLISTVHRAFRSNKDYVAAINKPMAYAASFKLRTNKKRPRFAVSQRNSQGRSPA